MINYGKYAIICDGAQYIVGIPTKIRDKKTGEEKNSMRGPRYFPTLESAISGLRRRMIADTMNTDAREELGEAIRRVEKLTKDFDAEIKRLTRE